MKNHLLKIIAFALVVLYGATGISAYQNLDGTTKNTFTIGGFPNPKGTIVIFPLSVTYGSASGGGTFGPVQAILKSGEENTTPGVVSGAVSVLSGATDSANSGSVTLRSGNTTTSGTSGGITLFTGTADHAGVTGDTIVTTGGNSGTGTSGQTFIKSGTTDSGTSGAVTVQSGEPTSGSSGQVSVFSSATDNGGSTGNVLVTTGDVLGGAGNTGNLTLKTGTVAGGGTRGQIFINSGTRNIIFKSGAEPDLTETHKLGTDSKLFLEVNSEYYLGDANAADKVFEAKQGGNARGSIRVGQTTPSGATAHISLSSDNTGGFGQLGVVTANNATADANATEDILVETGNKSAGTGDSGSVSILTGTSAGGTRGTVTIDSSDLIVASDIIPDGDNTRTIGRVGATYVEAFIDTVTAASPLTLRSIDENAASPTGIVTIKSGDNAGAGDSGNVDISTGTAGGTRGDITFAGADADFSGMTSVSFGAATITGVANDTLSNLTSPTALNQSILPDATANNRDLGSLANEFNKLWVDNSIESSFSGEVLDAPRLSIHSGDLTLPSGSTANASIRQDNGTEADATMALFTGDRGTVNAVSTGALFLETGNKLAGTGNSGAILVKTGTSVGGTRGTVTVDGGDIILKDGSEGTSGHVWTSTNTSGAGSWSALPSSGANTALSNLSSVAINTDLIGATADFTLKSSNGAGTTDNILVTSGNSTGADSGTASLQSGSAAAGTSGTITIQSGGAQSATGGVDVITGDATAGSSGAIAIFTGTSASGSITGDVTVNTGNSTASDSGAFLFETGSTNTSGNSGAVTLGSGEVSGGNATGLSGDVVVRSGAITEATNLVDTGTLTLKSGDTSGDGTTGVVSLVSGDNTNAGITGAVTVSSGTASGSDTGDTSVLTGDADGTSGNILVKSGNATNTDSGSVTLETGTAGGTRGVIIFNDGTEGTPGNVWTEGANPGEGSWAAPAGGGDSWGDPVDADITPDGSLTRSIGTNALGFLGIRGQALHVIYATGSSSGRLQGGNTTTPSGLTTHATFLGQASFGVVNNPNLGIVTPSTSSTFTGDTGSVIIETGNKTSGSDATGAIDLTTGIATSGASGRIRLETGITDGTATTGAIEIFTGDGGSGVTGAVDIESGGNNSASATGSVVLTSGTNAGAGNSGHVFITTGGAGGTSGTIFIQTGAGGTDGDISMSATKVDMTLAGSLDVAGIRTDGLRANTVKVVGDPCGDAVAYPESTLFYNNTSDYFCFCDGAGADKQMHSPATDCF